MMESVVSPSTDPIKNPKLLIENTLKMQEIKFNIQVLTDNFYLTNELIKELNQYKRDVPLTDEIKKKIKELNLRIEEKIVLIQTHILYINKIINGDTLFSKIINSITSKFQKMCESYYKLENPQKLNFVRTVTPKIDNSKIKLGFNLELGAPVMFSYNDDNKEGQGLYGYITSVNPLKVLYYGNELTEPFIKKVTVVKHLPFDNFTKNMDSELTTLKIFLQNEGTRFFNQTNTRVALTKPTSRSVNRTGGRGIYKRNRKTKCKKQNQKNKKNIKNTKRKYT